MLLWDGAGPDEPGSVKLTLVKRAVPFSAVDSAPTEMSALTVEAEMSASTPSRQTAEPTAPSTHSDMGNTYAPTMEVLTSTAGEVEPETRTTSAPPSTPAATVAQTSGPAIEVPTTVASNDATTVKPSNEETTLETKQTTVVPPVQETNEPIGPTTTTAPETGAASVVTTSTSEQTACPTAPATGTPAPSPNTTGSSLTTKVAGSTSSRSGNFPNLPPMGAPMNPMSLDDYSGRIGVVRNSTTAAPPALPVPMKPISPSPLG